MLPEQLKASIGPARGGFSEGLKKELLYGEQTPLKNEERVKDQLYLIREMFPHPPAHLANPSYLGIQTPHRARSHSSPEGQRFIRRQERRPRSFLWQKTLSVVAVVALVGVFVFTQSTDMAQAGTARTESVAGEVYRVTESGDQLVLGEGTVLQEGESLITGEVGAATLSLFEGSTVRIAPQTELELQILQYEEGSGHSIQLELTSGRIWVRNNKTPSAEGVLRIQSQDTIAEVGALAALEAENDTFRSWERTSYISQKNDQEDALLLLAGEQATLRNGSLQKRTVPEIFGQDIFVVANMRADAEDLSSLSQELIAPQQNQGIWSEIESLLSANSSELAELEEGLRSYFLALLDSDADPEALYAEVLALVESLPPEHMPEGKRLLEDIHQQLSSVLPGDPLYPGKLATEDFMVSFSTQEQQATLVASLQTERIYEAQTLARRGQGALATEIIRSSSTARSAEPGETDFLVEVEQLAALSNISEDEISSDVLQEAEAQALQEIIPSTTTTVYSPEAQEILLRLGQYSSDVGRRNTLEDALEDLPNTPQTLELLQEIQSGSEGNVNTVIKEKIFQIAASEKRRQEREEILSNPPQITTAGRRGGGGNTEDVTEEPIQTTAAEEEEVVVTPASAEEIIPPEVVPTEVEIPSEGITPEEDDENSEDSEDDLDDDEQEPLESSSEGELEEREQELEETIESGISPRRSVAPEAEEL